MWNSWCFRTDVRKNEIVNVNELTDNFFIDFDVILSVAIEKFEHFDDIDSDIDVNVAEKIDETDETCETNEQMIVDFFLILYVNSDVKIQKFEFFDVINEIDDAIDFWIWCSRICSWNLFLKLKSASQCLQIICEFVQWNWICFNRRFIDEKWTKHSTHEWYCDEEFKIKINDFAINSSEIIENAHVKSLSKFCMMLKIWFLNHANAKSRTHLNNKSNTFCFKYWCWICWKFCKKFIILLYRSNFKISHMRIESKISIS